MKLQRIIAKDSRAANEQAIAKYGKDVLIVSNTKVNGMTELIVAIEIEANSYEQEAKVAKDVPVSNLFHQTLMQQVEADAIHFEKESDEKVESPSGFEEFRSSHEVLSKNASVSKVQSISYAAKIPIACHIHQDLATWSKTGLQLGGSFMNPATQKHEKADATTQASEVTVSQAAIEPPKQDLDSYQAQSIMQFIQTELKQLRREVRMSQQLQAWAAKGAPHRWNEAMCSVGMDAQLRALLLSEIELDSSDESAMEMITTQLTSSLPFHNHTLASGQMFRTPGVHLFAGPAGGGKTSMLAKIAHQLTQNYSSENILLISMNDTRPGAWSQLQMWAAKVGCLAMRALDQSTFETLLSENLGKFILIDTSADQIESLKSIRHTTHMHCHLVLPAHIPSAVIQKWMNPEKSLPWTDLYITRMDESTQPWALLKASMDYGICSAKASNGSGLEELVDNFDSQSLLAHSLLVLKNALSPEVEVTPVATVIQQPAPKIVQENLHDSTVSPVLVDKPRRSRKYSTQGITLQ